MRFLVTGASGNLGGYLLRELVSTAEAVVAWSGSRAGERFGMPLRPVPLTDRDAVRRAFREARAHVILHGAALSSMAECVRDPDRARAINAGGTALLAELAAETQSRLLLVSTDLVFDGEQGNYCEDDPPAPL